MDKRTFVNAQRGQAGHLGDKEFEDVDGDEGSAVELDVLDFVVKVVNCDTCVFVRPFSWLSCSTTYTSSSSL